MSVVPSDMMGGAHVARVNVQHEVFVVVGSFVPRMVFRVLLFPVSVFLFSPSVSTMEPNP